MQTDLLTPLFTKTLEGKLKWIKFPNGIYRTDTNICAVEIRKIDLEKLQIDFIIKTTDKSVESSFKIDKKGQNKDIITQFEKYLRTNITSNLDYLKWTNMNTIKKLHRDLIENF